VDSLLPDYGIDFSQSNQVLLEQVQALNAEQHAEKFMNNEISDPNYKHELSAALLWAIKKDGSYKLLGAHPDVYELLSQELMDFSTYQGILIHTTGWAAPLNNDGSVSSTAPSQHDKRRRVSLVSCVMDGSVGSALCFADDSEIVLDPGSATGSLAEALLSFWEKNKDPF
jgi:hypothetical protein